MSTSLRALFPFAFAIAAITGCAVESGQDQEPTTEDQGEVNQEEKTVEASQTPTVQTNLTPQKKAIVDLGGSGGVNCKKCN